MSSNSEAGSLVGAAMFKWLWPLVPGMAIGLMGYGFLRSDVSHIKSQQDVTTADHDRIVRMEAQLDDVKDDVSEIKQAVKQIAEEGKR